MDFIEETKANFKKLGLPDPKSISGKPCVFYETKKPIIHGATIDRFTSYIESGKFYVTFYLINHKSEEQLSVAYHSLDNTWIIYPYKRLGFLEIG